MRWFGSTPSFAEMAITFSLKALSTFLPQATRSPRAWARRTGTADRRRRQRTGPSRTRRRTFFLRKNGDVDVLRVRVDAVIGAPRPRPDHGAANLSVPDDVLHALVPRSHDGVGDRLRVAAVLWIVRDIARRDHARGAVDDPGVVIGVPRLVGRIADRPVTRRLSIWRHPIDLREELVQRLGHPPAPYVARQHRGAAWRRSGRFVVVSVRSDFVLKEVSDDVSERSLWARGPLLLYALGSWWHRKSLPSRNPIGDDRKDSINVQKDIMQSIRVSCGEGELAPALKTKDHFGLRPKALRSSSLAFSSRAWSSADKFLPARLM